MPRRTLALVLALITVVAAVAAVLAGRACSASPAGLGAAALDHTRAILAFGPRPPGSAALDDVRRHLAEQLSACGWTSVEQPFDRDTPAGRIRFANVRARLADQDPAAAWSRPVNLLLACHIDSKVIPGIDFLGADDAASAAGAILTIARHLANHHPAHARRIELVFFDGEESFGRDITPFDGLYGSRHYARQLKQWQTLPAHGIVLDMIGHRNLTIRIPSDTPQSLRDALFQATRKARATRHFSVADAPVTDDHVPLNLAGVPTIDIVADFPRAPWWHTPRDNLHLLSQDSLDASIHTTLTLIDSLLD